MVMPGTDNLYPPFSRPTVFGAAVVSEQAFGQAPSVGALDEAARADHTHGTPSAATLITTLGTGWTTLYEVDFSAQPNQNLAPAGNYVIDGKTYTSINTAAASSFQVINGTGVQIAVPAVGVQYGAAIQTAPRLVLPLSEVWPAYDADEHRLRVTAYVTTAQAFNGTLAGSKVGVETSSAPLSFFAVAQLMRTGGNQSTQLLVNENNTAQQIQPTTMAGLVAMGLDFSDIDCIYLRRATYVGPGWPAAWTPQASYGIHPSGGGFGNGRVYRTGAQDHRIVFAVDNGNGAAVNSGVLVRLKVEGRFR